MVAAASWMSAFYSVFQTETVTLGVSLMLPWGFFVLFCFCVLFCLSLLFRAVPVEYGGSQVRG